MKSVRTSHKECFENKSRLEKEGQKENMLELETGTGSKMSRKPFTGK